MIRPVLNKEKYLVEQMKKLVDIETLFSWLGIQIKKKSLKEIRARCPIHGGSNDTSLSFLKTTRKWKCWSKACETEYGGDIVGLIRAVKRCSFGEAVQLLSQITGISIDGELDENLVIDSIQSKIVRETIEDTEFQKMKKLPFIIDKRTDRNGLEYFIHRGFKEETLKYFDVGGLYFDKDGVRRVIIPIRDEMGNLVGVQGRRVDSIKDTKYRTEGFDKGAILYNLNNAKYYLGIPPTLILVEGVTDVWSLWQMDYYNVVSSLGVSLSTLQTSLLVKYAMNVIVLFDGDSAGVNGFKRLKKECGIGVNVYNIELPAGLDPAEVDPSWLSIELSSIYRKIGMLK